MLYPVSGGVKLASVSYKHSRTRTSIKCHPDKIFFFKLLYNVLQSYEGSSSHSKSVLYKEFYEASDKMTEPPLILQIDSSHFYLFLHATLAKTVTTSTLGNLAANLA